VARPRLVDHDVFWHSGETAGSRACIVLDSTGLAAAGRHLPLVVINPLNLPRARVAITVMRAWSPRTPPRELGPPARTRTAIPSCVSVKTRITPIIRPILQPVSRLFGQRRFSQAVADAGGTRLKIHIGFGDRRLPG
jgi:hypothetical protein